MKKLLIILFAFSLGGCISERRCERLYPHKQIKKDSVFIISKETLHDTIVKIGEDSVTLSALIECQQDGQLLFKQLELANTNSKIKAKIVYKDKILYMDCKTDSQSIYISYKNKFEKHFADTTVTEYVQQKYIPKWIYFAVGVISIVMLIIGLKISKML